MNGLLSPDDMMMRGAQGTPNNSDALMQSLYGLGDYADAGMILPYAITPDGERVLSFPAPIQSVARTVARGMGAIPLETDPYTGMLSENVLADAAEAAGLFTGAGLLAPKPAGAIGMSGGGGGVTRTIPPRQVDDLGFYSQALEAAARLPQAKGTGQQMEAMLTKAGVKPDEIAFTPGLRGLLDQPQVTREELVGLLQENQIRPQETVLQGGDIFGESQLRFNDPEVMEPDYDYDISGRVDDLMYMFDPDDIKSALISAGFDEDYASTIAFKADNANFPDETTSWADRLTRTEQSEIENAFADQAKAEYYEEPRFVWRDPDTDYEIRGNDNSGYEVYGPSGAPIRGEAWSLNEARALATNAAYDAGDIGVGPAGEARFGQEGWVEEGGTNYREMLLQVPKYEGMQGEFYKGSHFDEPNIAVHVRTKDRKMAKDAGDTLYVEELQSDWGQQGRRVGFDTPKDKKDLQSAQDQYEPFLNEMNKQIGIKNDAKREFAKLVANQIGGEVSGSSSGGSVYLHDKPVMNDYNAEEILISGSGTIRLYDPLSGEYNRVNVTVPKEIKDRYKIAVNRWNELDAESKLLQKMVRRTADTPMGPFVGNSEKFAELGIKRLLSKAVQEDKKYVSFSSGDVQYDRWNEDGLVPFYDKIIPKVAKKVAKRFDPDAEVGPMQVRMDEANFNDKAERFTIEITPKMRAAIQEGVPLFVTGGQGLLAAGEGMRQQPQQGILY